MESCLVWKTRPILEQALFEDMIDDQERFPSLLFVFVMIMMVKERKKNPRLPVDSRQKGSHSSGLVHPRGFNNEDGEEQPKPRAREREKRKLRSSLPLDPLVTVPVVYGRNVGFSSYHSRPVSREV